MLFSKPKSKLGVDIGSTHIKIVQLRPKDKQFVLETYGFVNVSYQVVNKENASTNVKESAELLKNLMKRAGVTTTKAVASLPNNSVFTSVIEMPKLPQSELKSAVEFEARKYVPLPLPEVALSWSIIDDKTPKTSDSRIKVLLTAVPTVVVDNYLKLFSMVGLEAEALEIEALALIRSLIHEDYNNSLIVDIGAKSTSLNLVDNGYLRLSKNLNVGGDTVSASLARSLSVNFPRAEQFKKDFGLASSAQIPQVMRPILDVIKNEAAQLINLFESRGQKIDKIVLTGGGSKLPNLKDYMATIGKPVVLADPWTNIIYSPNLKPIIEPLGMNLAVAVGLAMRQPKT